LTATPPSCPRHDLLDQPVKMRRRLEVDADPIGAGAGELVDVTLGSTI